MKKFHIGYIPGIYDMFNISHLNDLKNAKAQCERLIVGLYTDKYLVDCGVQPPLIQYADRKRIVQSIQYVDDVLPHNSDDYNDIYNKCYYDVVFVGNEICSPFLNEQVIENKCIVSLAKDYFSSRFVLETPQTPIYGKNVGYTTGVFDMFHIGHLNIIERAKEYCDYLIVGVSTDENVENYKHKRPVVPFEERASIIQSLRFVDAVVPQTNMDKLAAWENLHFNIMFHGDDWKGSVMYNDVEAKLNAVGCVTKYLPHTDGISTSLLREKLSI